MVRAVDCKHTPTLFQILNLTINIPEIYILYRVVPPQPLLFVGQSKSVTFFITLSKHVENYNHKSDTVKTLLLLRYNNALWKFLSIKQLYTWALHQRQNGTFFFYIPEVVPKAALVGTYIHLVNLVVWFTCKLHPNLLCACLPQLVISVGGGE